MYTSLQPSGVHSSLAVSFRSIGFELEIWPDNRIFKLVSPVAPHFHSLYNPNRCKCSCYPECECRLLICLILYHVNRPTDIENKVMVTKEESVGRDKLGVWD